MIGTLIFKNLGYKKLNLLLSVLLFTLGTAIISLLLLVQNGVSNKLDKDLNDIDMVVGAKGSPLQLVLSAVYHIDAPTGNINEAKLAKLTSSPLIEQVIPLAYGDSYRGYRILGTTPDYIDKYEGKLQSGKLNEAVMEVVLGSKAAAIEGLKVGDTFTGTHGNEGEAHADHPYKVTGLLEASGTVLDYLVITTVETIRHIHEHEEEDNAKAVPMATMGRRAGEKLDTVQQHEAHPEQITAALIKFRSPMAIMTFPRIVNAQSNFMAVNPTLEINRLQNLMSIGANTLQAIAIAIMVISGISIFITLYNRLKERKYELALIRTMGGSRWLVCGLMLAEGVILALIGTAAGLALSRFGLWLIGKGGNYNSQIPFTFGLLPQEYILWAVCIILGLLAALIPAVSAFKLNISKTLSNG